MSSLFKSLFDSFPQSEDEFKIEWIESVILIINQKFELLDHYFDNLSDLIIESIQYDSEEVSIHAIKFWKILIELEYDYNKKYEKNQGFIERAIKSKLVLGLLDCLVKQDEDRDECETINFFALNTISVLVKNIQRDLIYETLINFIIENLTNDDWRFREAAIGLFSVLLESDWKLSDLLTNSFPQILYSFNEDSLLLKGTILTFIGKSFQYYSKYLGKFVDESNDILMNSLKNHENPRLQSKSFCSVNQMIMSRNLTNVSEVINLFMKFMYNYTIDENSIYYLNAFISMESHIMKYGDDKILLELIKILFEMCYDNTSNILNDLKVCVINLRTKLGDKLPKEYESEVKLILEKGIEY